jgi:hypothetical protein
VTSSLVALSPDDARDALLAVRLLEISRDGQVALQDRLTALDEQLRACEGRTCNPCLQVAPVEVDLWPTRLRWMAGGAGVVLLAVGAGFAAGW